MLCWLSCVCVVLGIVMVAPGVVDAGYERTCSPEMMSEGPMGQHTLCGSRLTEAISGICDVIGYSITPNRRKRDDAAVQPALKDILVNRREALDYLGKRANGLDRTGVVCECCHHRCNVRELMEYCDLTTKRSPVVRRADTESSQQGALYSGPGNW